MDGVPKTLRHFLTTEHAAIHKGQAAIYGLISSTPMITPIAFSEFKARVPEKILATVTAFAEERDLRFSSKGSIGYDVMYTDMNNFVANLFFLTSDTGKTVFVNLDGYIELVEIPDPDGVSAPSHMWR